MTTKTEQIRALNDQLRQNFSEGTAVMTCGVAALGAEAVALIVKTISVYDDFCHANDPHEEHDFGSFEADGHDDLFQDRLLRQEPHLPFARRSRSLRHRARHHDHASRRVLTDGARAIAAEVQRANTDGDTSWMRKLTVLRRSHSPKQKR